MAFSLFKIEFLMLRFFKKRLIIAVFDLIVLSNAYRVLISQILGLKREEKCFFVIQISLTKIIEKTTIWTIFCF